MFCTQCKTSANLILKVVCVAVNGEVAHGNGGHGGSHMIVENGPVEPEDNSLIIQNLSSMLPPKVVLLMHCFIH